MDLDGMDLETVADELYALPVDEFIPTRNARVKEARGAKDRELAAAIGALRKPSTSAWVVNLLARERSDLVDQLLELGEALRSAQETLSGPDLRALSSQRHRVIASIVGEARKLAAAQGVRVSDSIERELEATFDAALADPTAADAVRTGRLETALSYAGLGAAPAGVPAPAPPKKPSPKPVRKASQKTSAPKKDDDAERREQERRAEERRRAEEALQAAETAAEEAESELTDARTAHEQAAAAREEAEQRVDDLTAQLEQAQADLSERSTEVRDRKRTMQRAEQHAQEAQRRVERARSALPN